ncbi:MAG TPA: FtsX-like permease family protein [Acidimicrobiales bacterium]|nr:FtsX-like permease family protein [Acidimicrobiales bacterium]
MTLVRLWLGSELRRRWRSHLALLVVIGAVGGIVLALSAGARRTAAAYDAFLTDRAVPDAEFDNLPPGVRADIARVRGVRAAGSYAPLFAAPDRKDVLPGQDFLVFAAADRSWMRSIDRPIVVRGRLPRADSAEDVVVNEDAATRYRLEVGTRTALQSLATEEGEALLAGRFDELDIHGPKPTVRVVGVVRTRLDLGYAGYARSYALASPAFYRAHGDAIFGFPPQLDVRVGGGTGVGRVVAGARHVAERAGPEVLQGFNANKIADSLAPVHDATRVQALALALVALAAGCAGALALAQLVARGVGARADDLAVLQAMGLDRPARARLATASVLPAAAGGAVLAVAVAVAASSRFPTGVSLRLGPAPGLAADPVVLAGGTALLLLVVLGTAAVTAFRARPAQVADDWSARVGLLDRAAAALPPAPRIGVRWALPRRDGARPGRGRAALGGTVAGVAALVAALTYWAALDHVVTTPAAYGWTFDVDAGGGDDPDAVAKLVNDALGNADVGDVAVARIAGSARIGTSTGDLYGFRRVRGAIGPSVLAGRAPAQGDEVMLGSRTARDLGKGIGSTVTVQAGPGAEEAALRVVGIGLLPTIESDRFAVGGVTTPDTLDRLARDTGYSDAVLRLRSGVDRAKALTRLRRAGLVSNQAKPPGSVRNLDLVRGYPLWVAALVAALGLLAAGQALVATARSRAGQVAVLRALGLTRPQVVGAVSSQGAALCGAGAVLGVPLGIAVGRWAWTASAHGLGVAEHGPAPAALLLRVVVAGLAILAAGGAAAGWWAGRRSPAAALRTQ